MAKFRMKSLTPTRKTTVGALGGAIATILVWALNTFVLTDPGQQITGEVAAALATIVSFGLSYFIPPSPNDVVVPVEP